MDYLYGNLPEIVDPCAYEVIEKDGTIKLQVDNDNRTISAQVIQTPGKLTIQQGDGDSIIFNGKDDVNVNLSDYKIQKVESNDGDIRSKYALMKWNSLTHTYEPSGDFIYLEEQLNELNIENGSTSNEDSKKVAKGNGGITSVQCINDVQNLPIPKQYLPIKNEYGQFDFIEIPNAVGQKVGSVIGGATRTGTQSFAFGGRAIGLSDIAIVSLTLQSGEQYLYYIENEKPLILRYVYDKSLVLNQTTSNTLQFTLPNDKGQVGVDFSLSWDENNKLKSITSPYNYPNVKVVRGFAQDTTAIGNQSISVGGGTQANLDWSQAFGLGTKTSTIGQMVIGTYNQDEKDALLIIGNGYFDFQNGKEVRSNALSIMRDGTVKLYDNGVGSADRLITQSTLDKIYQELVQQDTIIRNELLESIKTNNQELYSQINQVDSKVNQNSVLISQVGNRLDTLGNKVSNAIDKYLDDDGVLIMDDGYLI